jgi:hypothetical protein
MGSWFLFGTLYCLDSYNFLAVPLLSIFVAGYYWAAFSTIVEEYKNRIAWERGRKLAQVAQSSAPALTDAP